MTSFQDKLTVAAQDNDSLVCVGLDPDPALMPIDDVLEFNKTIIDATKDLVCSYKPNMAFYEAMGIQGLEILQCTLEYIPDNIPVICDGKRGDIGSTSKAYAKAVFDQWGFDAVTVSPYLGTDSLEPFLEYADRGVLVLCHTSTPGASDFQDLRVGNTNLLPSSQMVEACLAAIWPGFINALHHLETDLLDLIKGLPNPQPFFRREEAHLAAMWPGFMDALQQLEAELSDILVGRINQKHSSPEENALNITTGNNSYRTNHIEDPTKSDSQVNFNECATRFGGWQRPLFEEVALRALEWNSHGNTGLVVGATYPQQLKSVRDLCPDMVILAPGIGAQGGDLENTVKYGVDANRGGLIVNSSRSIIYASNYESNFGKEARKAADKLRRSINKLRNQTTHSPNRPAVPA